MTKGHGKGHFRLAELCWRRILSWVAIVTIGILGNFVRGAMITYLSVIFSLRNILPDQNPL